MEGCFAFAGWKREKQVTLGGRKEAKKGGKKEESNAVRGLYIYHVVH